MFGEKPFLSACFSFHFSPSSSDDSDYYYYYYYYDYY